MVVEEAYPHDLRVGWSIENSSTMLGESPNSFAYCSTARKAENGMFVDWGESFYKNDVVTCCMVSFSYTVLSLI